MTIFVVGIVADTARQGYMGPEGNIVLNVERSVLRKEDGLNRREFGRSRERDNRGLRVLLRTE